MSEKPYKEYYKDLYALQDGVFKILEEYDFYLTGGTALSRFYLNHRYSDDLDFFVHQKADFLDSVKEIIARLKAKFSVRPKRCGKTIAEMIEVLRHRKAGANTRFAPT